MNVPIWITFLVAAAVISFGGYRVSLIWRTPESEEIAQKRGGLYALPKRTHALFGILYLLLGAFLIASGLGYRLSPF